jgi:hypothetical protein
MRAELSGLLPQASAEAVTTPFLLAVLDLLDEETKVTVDRVFLSWLAIPWTVRVDTLRANPGATLTRLMQQIHTGSEFGQPGEPSGDEIPNDFHPGRSSTGRISGLKGGCVWRKGRRRPSCSCPAKADR